MRLAFAALLAILITVASRAAEETPEAAVSISKRFEAEIRSLQTEHSKSLAVQRKALADATNVAKQAFDESVGAAATVYVKLLDNLSANAKDTGDLDAVLSLKAEREKVTLTGVTGKTAKLPAEAVKGRSTFDAALSKAKTGFDSANAKIRKETEAVEKAAIAAFTIKARETHAGYLRELLDLEKSETKDGRIESAVAVRTFRLRAEKEGPPQPTFGEDADPKSPFAARVGEAKDRLIRKYGGSAESELAVARGLAYLARQQKPDGSWVYDGASRTDTIASTGMCLLPFLAAGETHKAGRKYQQNVLRGLQYLISQQRPDGGFKGTSLTMYSHGIASIALNEAYGMTKDRNLLLRPAQAATNFIVAKQGADGSWGYAPGTNGDTSILGWQVQALKAANLSKDIVVPKQCIASAMKFLDKVASGEHKERFGYTGPNGAPGSSLTAIGLLSRNTFGNWKRDSEGFVAGVESISKRGPAKAPALGDMYYYYYATQVLRIADDTKWQDWNEGPEIDGKRTGGMRDWLIALQDKKEGQNSGSWTSDGAILGGSCGRVGTTAMAVLILESYYRYHQ